MNLGDKVEDKITGFTGTATGHVQYLHAPDSYLVESKVTGPAEEPLSKWITVNRLKLV